MTGQKRHASAAIVAAVLAAVTLLTATACDPGWPDNRPFPSTATATLRPARTPPPLKPLESLIPPDWSTSLCSRIPPAGNYWSATPTASYGCAIDLGDSGGAKAAGETITGDQWSANPGYAGSEALGDWLSNQPLHVQQVSSITDCPATDDNVACEFPWSSPGYPGYWAIPSQDTLFDVKGAHADAQHGDAGTQAWFRKNVEGK